MLAALALALTATHASDPASVWQRWEHEPTSGAEHADPCADVTLRVVDDGLDGEEIRAYGSRDVYRSVPTDWSINTETKQAFFGKVREITGRQAGDG